MQHKRLIGLSLVALLISGSITAVFLLSRADSPARQHKHGQIVYDEKDSFPTTIGHDDPDLYDDDTYWSVRSFEPPQLK